MYHYDIDVSSCDLNDEGMYAEKHYWAFLIMSHFHFDIDISLVSVRYDKLSPSVKVRKL